MKTRQTAVLLLIGAALTLSLHQARTEDAGDLQEKAIKEAVAKAAPSVVQIVTSGGTDIVGGQRGIRKGIGPTTGVILTQDGYIISSAFNFANKPSAITIAIPGHKEQKTAKVIATDQTRMLTLLKIDATALTVPQFVPKSEMKVGQSALALGRTFNVGNVDEMPAVSFGIISALNRIWGKAIQTDAKVSPSNYGGPLIDISGRVQGVLVPLSPRAVGETAGVEWYDSGIGFAVPLEDIMAVLDRLKKGKDLNRGVMGVNMKSQDEFGTLPEVGMVQPDSAAEKAGLKPGDLITHLGGKSVNSYAQVQHQLGSKYEGDSIEVKYKRDGKEQPAIKVVLGSAVSVAGQSFMGILPMRDDPETGVAIRFVYPKSPADKAGLKDGDRIMKVGRQAMAKGPANLVEVKSRDQLLGMLDPLPPGLELTLDVKRKAGGKSEQVKVKLGPWTEEIPEKLPEPATMKKALGKAPAKPDKEKKEGEKKEGVEKKDEKKEGEEKKAETGLLKRKTANGDNSYWVFVPRDYDPNVAYALVVWLHPPGRNKDEDVDSITDAWIDSCEDNHIILVGPDAPTGKWTPGDSEFVQEAVRTVSTQYTIDKRRVVAHGMGVGGQMAFYLGFSKRDMFRGVATTGAALDNNPKERVANQPLSFFIVAGAKDPLKDAVKATKDKLTEFKYPVIHREIPDRGHEYLKATVLEELVRWIDSLDRM